MHQEGNQFHFSALELECLELVSALQQRPYIKPLPGTRLRSARRTLTESSEHIREAESTHCCPSDEETQVIQPPCTRAQG